MSLSDVAASLRRAPRVDPLGWKPLSWIGLLTASRWVSSRGCYLYMCVCVFIPFHLLASSGCTMSMTYVRGSDQRSFVVDILWVLLPSPIISVSEPILFHLRRRKLQPAPDWRENEWYNATLRKDDILI